MVVNALNLLTDLPKEIITFSDDMDGLRKVPDNVPNKKILTDNLHKPLTVVPDPFQKFGSFGEYNNEMLKKFLDQFNFKYNFLSSTKLYKSGFFNEPLKKTLKNYNDKLLDHQLHYCYATCNLLNVDKKIYNDFRTDLINLFKGG